MNKLYLISLRGLLFFLIFYGQITLAQQGNGIPKTSQIITGVVKDETGQPIPSVTVKIKGTSGGVAADINGKYKVAVSSSDAVLVFSFIGYDPQEISVGKKKVIDVLLKPHSNLLNEAVVVGYGTQKRSDITGSVASVSIKNKDEVPVLGTAQLLQGQLSGVQVTQNQAQPGGNAFSIRIRGTNSINSSSEPLYVIDGYAGGDVSTVNPSDIASIEVLKDASSTAIYGSRGANGVIIITTKRGTAGGHSVNFDAYTGVQKVGKQYNMMNAQQFGTYLNRLQQENNLNNKTNIALPYTQDQINNFGEGTNWQKEIFRTAPISNLSLSFNGGTTDTRYFLSFNYFDQKGIILASAYKRGILHFNLDQNISKNLKIGSSSQISYDYQNASSVNTAGGSTTPSILWDAVRFSPILPVRDAYGAYTYVNGPSPLVTPLGNPVAYSNEALDNNYNIRIFTNFYGELEPVKGLKLRSSLGVNYRNAGSENFVPSDLYVGGPTGGSASQGSIQNYDWLNENTLTFDKQFNKDNALNVVVGYTLQHFYNRNFSGGITMLSTNALGADNLSIGTASTPTSNLLENALMSYLGRANYRLKEKYLFTFTIRSDGSSRFGENKKYGYFPSAAFAWRLSEEAFIKNIKSISDLKLRISYGVTGNQEIGSYNSIAQYTSNAYTLGSNAARVVGFSPGNIPNADLAWESTASYDIGIDLGLFANRINITADAYLKTTSNLLLNESIPQSSGYSSILVNAGSVQNKGIEFAINTDNIDTKNFKWSTSANIAANRNKVLNLGTNRQIFAGDLSGSLFPSSTAKSSILLIGQPIGSFYGYVFDGIWQTQDQITASGTKQAVKPGDPIYKDLNGDGIINGADRQIIGHALPNFTYGITNNFSLGKFNLNVFLQGVQGNSILNENLYEIQNGSPNFNKLAYILTDSWNGPGTSNTLPRVSSVLRRSTGITSDVVENGSYLRIKTATLSYNIPLNNLTKIFKSASAYFTVQNLATFTKYSGYDPEVNSFSPSNSLSLGTDYNAYPNYRTYLLGVKMGF